MCVLVPPALALIGFSLVSGSEYANAVARNGLFGLNALKSPSAYDLWQVDLSDAPLDTIHNTLPIPVEQFTRFTMADWAQVGGWGTLY